MKSGQGDWRQPFLSLQSSSHIVVRNVHVAWFGRGLDGLDAKLGLGSILVSNLDWRRGFVAMKSCKRSVSHLDVGSSLFFFCGLFLGESQSNVEKGMCDFGDAEGV